MATSEFSPSAPGTTTYLRKNYFRSSPLTHAESYRRAWGKTGLGIGLVIIGTVGTLVAYYASEWQYAVMSIIGGVLFGLWMTVRGAGDMLTNSKIEDRQVKCPFCDHEHTVLINAGWLYCENCEQLLLLGYSHAESSLIQIECPYCSRTMGVEETSRGLGFRCDDCNLRMVTENGVLRKADRETVTCANRHCQAVLDSTVFYCRECGQLTSEGARELAGATGVDARLRKSPHGHMVMGRALLQHLQSTVKGSEFDASELSSTNEMLWKLAEMWESFEEAALDEFSRHQIAELLEPVDHLYAMLLLRLGATYLASRKRYPRDAVFCTLPDDDSTPFGTKDHFKWVLETRQAALNRLLASDEIRQSHQFTSWKNASSLIKFKTKTSDTGEVKKCWVNNKRQLQDLLGEAESLSPGCVAIAEELRWL
jgi:ribosomal protein L37AE/L43A